MGQPREPPGESASFPFLWLDRVTLCTRCYWRWVAHLPDVLVAASAVACLETSVRKLRSCVQYLLSFQGSFF